MNQKGKEVYKVNDLVLSVRHDCDRRKWDEDRYEAFLEILCGGRYYQKEAIQTALNYILSGEYQDLKSLAKENWESNIYLEDRYGTWKNFVRHLQLPDKLSASIDLATGTGKSYVIYGIAMILLAEGAIDRVLVLCPSTTIESELYKKFKSLAGNAELSDTLPADAKLTIPKIIQADETITTGCICVENRDAIYSHVKSSSIKNSLREKGARVAVLNDEVHHVANEPEGKIKRWKEFLDNPIYGFKIILGFSGTCYIGNSYFADVIYRYSLKKAIEDNFVKKIKYLTDIERTGEENEDWQLRVNMHEAIKKELMKRSIRPLSIIVTPTIAKCKQVGEELKAYLVSHHRYSDTEAGEKVLTIYNNAPGVSELPLLDDKTSKIEWVVSVSMLNEGWDVKRVFQIVPHEERAFNSKLLIAQVLGRGLRIPDGWKGEQPVVAVFNHSAWASNIRHLVNEILETERVLTSKVIVDSPYHFEIHNLRYDFIPKTEVKLRKAPYDLLTKNKIDIPTETATVEVNLQFEQAVNGLGENWSTIVKRKKYAPEEIATYMFHFLEKLDMEMSSVENQEVEYAKEFPYARLLSIVKNSLGDQEFCTEANKQKLLQALGTVRRTKTKIVRYEQDPKCLFTIDTRTRPNESASAAQLSRDKVAVVSSISKNYVEEAQLEFFNEIIEEAGEYNCIFVKNRHDLKTPVNVVFAEHANERKFIVHLKDSKNAQHIDAWIKSTSMNFYSIDYSWTKGEHAKRAKFNPDFFIKVSNQIIVIEIKDDCEIKEPSRENIKKNEFALAHFERLNSVLKLQGLNTKYYFHFLSPRDYPDFFSLLRNEKISSFRSKLDVALKASYA